MNILMIDNFDSFTYNLVDEIEKIGCDVSIYRNNISMKEIEKVITETDFKLIVISPGPSNPSNAGICKAVIRKYHRDIAVFGVCLGFQCIVEEFGGKVSRCYEVLHGKSSIITHNNQNIFKGLPNPIHVGRYHSLYAESIPKGFIVAANHRDIPMAIYHEKYNISGVQFHPESILTASGNSLINNLIRRIKDVG
ncbi:MAG: aminodeoxychorismate/anthranilate synthase component II [Candidatus Marinimicrobia bacterium]|nr:aminodeoxychorismate/anthranilate synthase component II [Candidatus Neomarinimicrobiota bacterium]